jgi:hypothetical protein
MRQDGDARDGPPLRPADDGLSADELRAEQAGDLPDRDAMSIISVGGLEAGLPPPEILDDLVGVGLPVRTLPLDDLPVEPPIDGLPIDGLPIGVPDVPGGSVDAAVKA